MGHVRLTINDTKVTVPEGTTILQAAQEAEVYVPTLCYHPSLPTSKGLEPHEFVFRGQERISS
ncbi:MAG TPA: 2Fe-2S iron-sulfur cluster-binding protein, partial [Anaerolineae bacterium]|nr:2Fe-2S iron-sulfur cluster-binding protein [Anaerolineae bacterium]